MSHKAKPKSGHHRAAPEASAVRPPLDAELSRSALESLAEGVAIANERGELIYMNPAGAQLVGIGFTDSKSDTWHERYGLFWPDTGKQLRPNEVPLARALQGDEVRGVELLIRNHALPDGLRIVVSASCIKDGAGAIKGGVVIYRNVTDTVRAHEELKQRERYLQAILDNLPDIAWLKDPEGRFLAVNQALARASGRPVDAILGKTDLDIWPRELAESYRADDAEVIRSRATMRIEEPLAASGGPTTIETIKTAIVDERGEILGTTGIARDITDRKRTEEELRLSKQDLERRIEDRTRDLQRAQEVSVRKERLAVLGQLAGGVAHQIRNPLAAIKNASYVLERALTLAGVSLPPADSVSGRRSSVLFGERGPDGVLRLSPEQQVAQSIAIIHEEIRRANDIISGLLDYARIRVPVRQVVGLNDLVAQVLAQADYPDSVNIHSKVGKFKIAVDPSQVQEALHVLIRNAVDAMADGGGTLTVDAREEGSTIVIGVEDTGVGIPANVAERLFEPLLTTKAMGLGLGLVTARTLVEAQGGQLTFLNPPDGSGARFEMRLPSGG